MPGARQKKKKKTKPPAAKRAPGLPQLRPGMPALDNVKEVVDFVSPQGVPYKILKTNETDAYDPPLPAANKSSKSKPLRKAR